MSCGVRGPMMKTVLNKKTLSRLCVHTSTAYKRCIFIAGCRRDLHSCWLNKIFILFEGDVQVKNEKSLWGLHSCSMYDFMNLVLIQYWVKVLQFEVISPLEFYLNSSCFALHCSTQMSFCFSYIFIFFQAQHTLTLLPCFVYTL